MTDRDLKCVHCFEDQSNYGNRVDAEFLFDGLSLCEEHYWQHRDVIDADEPDHQHQFLPWLTLPNGSSWTKCANCEDAEQQYDH